MLKRFILDETGATAIEYALIAGTLAVSIVGTLTFVGQGYESMYENIKDVMVANAPTPTP